MSITLFLLNKKGYESLIHILQNKNYISLIDKVITAEDKGNKEDCCNEIFELCKDHNIDVYKKDEDYIINSEFSLAIGWRWLIINAKNLIVLHDSLLPKYRGFSPLPNMLINGEEEIGATAIFANNKMDQGEIIISEKTTIVYPIKISEAIDIMSSIYVSLVLKIFSKLFRKERISHFKQNESLATYSVWRDFEDYFIDWSKDAKYIERFVDAVGYPYDGAKTYVDGKKLITIDKVEAIERYKLETPKYGKILTFENEFPIVICGENTLRIIDAKDEHGDIYKFNKLRVRLT
ncbi:methionyl-tRNA formyltransferase [Aequorivita flava]|uniref:Formyltransferase family protein n=1 Tax=Aequorivita flava TaxID=3114371 RepID=A0AB35YTR3_9FLAO